MEEPENNVTQNRPTILLVDDEESIQTLLAYPLRRDGYEVVVARDGREGLDEFAAGRVDLVVPLEEYSTPVRKVECVRRHTGVGISLDAFDHRVRHRVQRELLSLELCPRY